MIEMFSNPQFWVSVLQIIAIDLLLSGDNAVVIALACRNLPPEQRRKGVMFGVAGAISLRVILTFFAVGLLSLPYIKLLGAVLLLWIGIKLLIPEEEHDPSSKIKADTHLWGAVKTIIVADFVMSLDNVIGVAGAAKGHFGLLVFGLLISIPMIVWSSQLILKLMDRFPIIIVAGGALLGFVAGEMLLTDVLVKEWVETQPHWLHWLVPALGGGLVVVAGKWLAARKLATQQIISLVDKQVSSSSNGRNLKG
ncbi:MAG: TerC family protein [Gallionellaceae bacterium]|nr:TerC family protein [Gallionellaceae bacterium]